MYTQTGKTTFNTNKNTNVVFVYLGTLHKTNTASTTLFWRNPYVAPAAPVAPANSSYKLL